VVIVRRAKSRLSLFAIPPHEEIEYAQARSTPERLYGRCCHGDNRAGLGHHSAAGYDLSKTLSAQATLKEFRWSAPHSAAVFTIKGPDGKPEDMTVASGSPAMFVKQGFMPKDFQIGDKMEISWHPALSAISAACWQA